MKCSSKCLNTYQIHNSRGFAGEAKWVVYVGAERVDSLTLQTEESQLAPINTKYELPTEKSAVNGSKGQRGKN